MEQYIVHGIMMITAILRGVFSALPSALYRKLAIEFPPEADLEEQVEEGGVTYTMSSSQPTRMNTSSRCCLHTAAFGAILAHNVVAVVSGTLGGQTVAGLVSSGSAITTAVLLGRYLLHDQVTLLGDGVAALLSTLGVVPMALAQPTLAHTTYTESFQTLELWLLTQSWPLYVASVAMLVVMFIASQYRAVRSSCKIPKTIFVMIASAAYAAMSAAGLASALVIGASFAANGTAALQSPTTYVALAAGMSSATVGTGMVKFLGAKHLPVSFATIAFNASARLAAPMADLATGYLTLEDQSTRFLIAMSVSTALQVVAIFWLTCSVPDEEEDLTDLAEPLTPRTSEATPRTRTSGDAVNNTVLTLLEAFSPRTHDFVDLTKPLTPRITPRSLEVTPRRMSVEVVNSTVLTLVEVFSPRSHDCESQRYAATTPLVSPKDSPATPRDWSSPKGPSVSFALTSPRRLIHDIMERRHGSHSSCDIELQCCEEKQRSGQDVDGRPGQPQYQHASSNDHASPLTLDTVSPRTVSLSMAPLAKKRRRDLETPCVACIDQDAHNVDPGHLTGGYPLSSNTEPTVT